MRLQYLQTRTPICFPVFISLISVSVVLRLYFYPSPLFLILVPLIASCFRLSFYILFFYLFFLCLQSKDFKG